jgi:hypothetical protein
LPSILRNFFDTDTACICYQGRGEVCDGINLLVQPETLLLWHRKLFRLFWKHTSKTHSRRSRLSAETISLIIEMAANNRLWGAERIRGELLKLDIRVSKRTIRRNKLVHRKFGIPHHSPLENDLGCKLQNMEMIYKASR